MSDPVEQLRVHIKDRGFKHWRVQATGHWQSTTVTAYQSTQPDGVQTTFHGPWKAVALAIDTLELGRVE